MRRAHKSQLVAAQAFMRSASSDWQIARKLLDLHGPDACFVAARQAEALRQSGGEEFARWKRIVIAVLELYEKRKTEGPSD